MTVPVRRTPYLISYRRFPDDGEMGDILSKMYTEVAFAVNERSIGIYDKFLLATGNKWFNDNEPQERRQEFRLVYEFENISATSNFPHGLTNIDFFTTIYGTAKTSTKHIPLPYVGIAANTSIEINITDNDINFVFDSSSPTLIKAVIVLPFIQRNT